jgi:hypothetical protein
MDQRCKCVCLSFGFVPQKTTIIQDSIVFRILRLLQCRYIQGNVAIRDCVVVCLRLWSDRHHAVIDLYSRFADVFTKYFSCDVFCDLLRSIVRTLSRPQHQRHAQRHHRLDEKELTVLSLASTLAPIEPSSPKPWKVYFHCYNCFQIIAFC